jgi:hypothetical protein
VFTTAQEEFKFHRVPAIPRALSTINPETDIRVRLLVQVEEKTDNGVMARDDSKTMEIVMEPEILSSLSPGSFVRVFCRVLPLETGFELRGELVQDMSRLDKELRNRINLLNSSAK